MVDTTVCTSSQAAKILNIHPNTLRNWEAKGVINSFRSTESGHRRYNIEEFLKTRTELKPEEKLNICYARVSSRGQKEDLKNQIDLLKELYPNYHVITDIGSGLNFKRRGLKTLLGYAKRGIIKELVVTYRDRLCRFGFELFEILIEGSGGNIVVLNKIESSPQEEMVKDLTSIIHVFSCRLYGLRRYKKTIKEAGKE